MADQRAVFLVSATVGPRVELRAIDSPAQIYVTTADLQAGYKDLVAHYEVTSNDPRGYLLRIAPRVGYAQRVEIGGLESAPVALRDEQIEFARSGRIGRAALALRLRVFLLPGLAPGRYALPVQVAATAL